MDISEFIKVENYTYEEYCDFLQCKYGIGKYDYMTKSWNKNPKCTRTKEGLLAHHKFESHAIMLSTKAYAMKNPFEWQQAKNIIYCDYLEHLFLHVLICEFPSAEKNDFESVGIGGVVNFIVPELNDFYSGWVTNQEWRRNCHNLIKNDKDVYFAILKRFKKIYTVDEISIVDRMCRSFNESYGLWSSKKNKAIYRKIKSI